MWSCSKERAELRQLLVIAEIALEFGDELPTCTVGRARRLSTQLAITLSYPVLREAMSMEKRYFTSDLSKRS
jgi:hypothetical protein